MLVNHRGNTKEILGLPNLSSVKKNPFLPDPPFWIFFPRISMKMAKIFLAGRNFSFLAKAHIKLFVGEYFGSFFLALFSLFPLFSMCSINC